MKKSIIFCITFIILSSCNNTSKIENPVLDNDQPTVKVIENLPLINTVVRYFPEEAMQRKQDTLIADYKISIISDISGDYTTMEYTIDSITQIDRYRDFKYKLIVKKANATLIDTTFTKQNFLDFTDEEFLKEANFQDYKFVKLNDTELVFSGYLGKPETDWAFIFNHYYNLDKKEFQLEEQVYEDEY